MAVIALLTDFGTRDYFTGAMKGAILSVNPRALIVDITHEIESQDIKAAGFTLRACCADFPVGTIFVAVVDPGVGSERRAILVETGDYFFIAPDNGLLSFVFHEPTDFRVFALTNQRFFARYISSSFHGRDVFAPVAAHLSKGVKAAEFGAEIKDFVRLAENKPRRINASEIVAEIIWIDRFGNLVTNLRRADLPEKFVIEIGAARIETLREFFAEGVGNEAFMIFGSAGFLEISVFKDSAQKLLRVAQGQQILVKSR
jgi:S-adenosylmethionine hydrolase